VHPRAAVLSQSHIAINLGDENFIALIVREPCGAGRRDQCRLKHFDAIRTAPQALSRTTRCTRQKYVSICVRVVSCFEWTFAARSKCRLGSSSIDPDEHDVRGGKRFWSKGCPQLVGKEDERLRKDRLEVAHGGRTVSGSSTIITLSPS